MAETLTVNGIDLSTLLIVSTARGLRGAAPMLGGDYTLPRRNGALSAAPRWFGPRVVTIEGTIAASSRAAMLDAVRALSALVMADGKDYTITRVIPRVSGGDLTVAATGHYLSGLDSVVTKGATARVSFDLLILSPWWYSTSDTTVTVAGTSTPTIVGDVATRRMTLTFSGATGQRLTNNTTGEWVQIVGSASVNTVLDVEAFTAVRSSASVAGEVTHNTAFADWLTLPAGAGSLTLTGGGSCAVAYRGAWL